MKNILFARLAWMVGIASLALLSACGGGGGGGSGNSGTTPTETGFAAITVPDGFKFETKGALSSITLSRTDSANLETGTTVTLSEWTCTTSDPQGLNEPEAISELMREVLTADVATVTLSDLRVPSANLLVKVFNGNSVYYAKRHDMASAGNLAISLNVAPASEAEMNQQFDKCP